MTARRATRSDLEPYLTIALLSLVMTGLACATLEQREINRRFNAANRIVLDASSSAVDRQRAKDEFSQVIASLTESQIMARPPEERANAFVMRAYAQWRTDFHSDATFSCRRAQVDKQLVAGSHADVMSQLLPGLILSSGEILRWHASERRVSPKRYDAYERNFVKAMKQVAEAEARLASNTPEDTRAFVRYAKWRVAANWRWVLVSMSGGKSGRVQQRQSQGSRSMVEVLGGAKESALSPVQALNALIREIPEESSLRALAEAESRTPPAPPWKTAKHGARS